MEGAPPHGIEGKVPIAPSRFLDTRTGQTPLQTSVRACPFPKTNLLPSSFLSLSTLVLTFGIEDPHISTGQVAKLKLGFRTKLGVRPSSLGTRCLKSTDHRSSCLPCSSVLPGFSGTHIPFLATPKSEVYRPLSHAYLVLAPRPRRASTPTRIPTRGAAAEAVANPEP